VAHVTPLPHKPLQVLSVTVRGLSCCTTCHSLKIPVVPHSNTILAALTLFTASQVYTVRSFTQSNLSSILQFSQCALNLLRNNFTPRPHCWSTPHLNCQHSYVDFEIYSSRFQPYRRPSVMEANVAARMHKNPGILTSRVRWWCLGNQASSAFSLATPEVLGSPIRARIRNMEGPQQK
jgi:hypothetical protein